MVMMTTIMVQVMVMQAVELPAMVDMVLVLVVTVEGMQEVLEADFMAGDIKPRMKGNI